MKNDKLSKIAALFLTIPALFVGCDSDDDSGTSTDFGTIASTYYEENGEATIFVPFRNGSLSADDIIVDGTATEGKDYQIVGVTEDGFSVKFFDDSDAEVDETVRLTIKGAGGNNRHIITLVSDDPGYLDIDLRWSHTETQVDMDLLLWLWDEEEETWVDIAQSWGSKYEHLVIDWTDDDGLYGLSYNYYAGPEGEDNDFTVTFTPTGVTVDGSDEAKVSSATFTDANITEDSDYPVLQTFEKSGTSFTDFSAITVPDEGSRVKFLRAKLAEAVAAKYKAAKN